MKTKRKSKQAKTTVKGENVNALEYLISIYSTKSALMYLARFKYSFRKQTVPQQPNSSLSD
jgi:hypothetical protein